MLFFSLNDALTVRNDERKDCSFNLFCSLLVCTFLIVARTGPIQSLGLGVATGGTTLAAYVTLSL